MEVEVRPPGFVDVDRDAAPMRHARRSPARSDATPQYDGLTRATSFASRVRVQRLARRRRLDTEADGQVGMQPGRDVDRDRAGQDERHQQRLVDVARDDDLVAGPQRRQQVGVVAGRGAIEQGKRNVQPPMRLLPTPRPGREHRFGDEGRRRLH